MATIALFVALGGTSVAAVHLAKNSVTSTSIKNGQVKNKDLANNAVTSSKVKDRSLLGKDFKAGQLPKGAQGPKGDQGAKGDQGQPGATGPSNGYFSTTSNTSTPVAWVTSGPGAAQRTLSLPAGKCILNGAVEANNNAGSVSTAGCDISVNGGSIDAVSVKLGADPGADQGAIAVTGGATLSSAGLATLECSASTTSGTWDSSSITAIKVASLN
jgi:hypothetical protein